MNVKSIFAIVFSIILITGCCTIKNDYVLKTEEQLVEQLKKRGCRIPEDVAVAADEDVGPEGGNLLRHRGHITPATHTYMSY